MASSLTLRFNRARRFSGLLAVACLSLAAMSFEPGQACQDNNCDQVCNTNTGFCTGPTGGKYYSQQMANVYCHRKGGPGGTPMMQVNVSQTTITNGSCAADCSDTPTSANPVSGNPQLGSGGRASTITVAINTVCSGA